MLFIEEKLKPADKYHRMRYYIEFVNNKKRISIIFNSDYKLRAAAETFEIGNQICASQGRYVWFHGMALKQTEVEIN